MQLMTPGRDGPRRGPGRGECGDAVAEQGDRGESVRVQRGDTVGLPAAGDDGGEVSEGAEQIAAGGGWLSEPASRQVMPKLGVVGQVMRRH